MGYNDTYLSKLLNTWGITFKENVPKRGAHVFRRYAQINNSGTSNWIKLSEYVVCFQSYESWTDFTLGQAILFTMYITYFGSSAEC